ncbi:FG-GAP repeat domain-containing protein [Streptomyces filamentosus]|uniref:FG-GAP repeat domain-containing protein n=1 Tax=Streptomyces filamentosus TaxID=67294 RepID=UPI0033C48F02
MKFTRILAGALAGGLGLLGVAVPSSEAADPSLTVISWNICGEAGAPRGEEGFCANRGTVEENARKVKDIAKLVTTDRNANAIMLQEVCGGNQGPSLSADGKKYFGTHEYALKKLLPTPDWSYFFAPATNLGDTSPDAAQYGSRCRGVLNGRLGTLTIVKGAISNPKWVQTLDESLIDPAKPTRLPAQCVTMVATSTAICNTHLLPKKASAPGDDVYRQIANVEAFVNDYAQTYGVATTVLGGDMNRATDVPEMQGLMAGRVKCMSGITHHGYDIANKKHLWSERDQILVTKPAGSNGFTGCDIDESRMDTTPNDAPADGHLPLPPNGMSDHAPVIGYLGSAAVPAVPAVPGDIRNGDGKPDLLAVSDEGKLYAYTGVGAATGEDEIAGSFTARTELGSGGWAGASISHRGDWTGDGREDLIAVFPSGTGSVLRAYPSKADGHLMGGQKLADIPYAGKAQVASVGDVTGDGLPDAVVSVDDKLWLYKSKPPQNGVAAVEIPTQAIGLSSWGPMTITAAGDVSTSKDSPLVQDQVPDLFVRDPNTNPTTGLTGVIYAYSGKTVPPFSKRWETGGHGFKADTRPLIAGGDANLDQTADLWATNEDGALLWYRNPAGAGVIVSHSGWGAITAIG